MPADRSITCRLLDPKCCHCSISNYKIFFNPFQQKNIHFQILTNKFEISFIAEFAIHTQTIGVKRATAKTFFSQIPLAIIPLGLLKSDKNSSSSINQKVHLVMYTHTHTHIHAHIHTHIYTLITSYNSDLLDTQSDIGNWKTHLVIVKEIVKEIWSKFGPILLWITKIFNLLRIFVFWNTSVHKL